jgi:cytoskeletal protein CcmA (bactofilin family)
MEQTPNENQTDDNLDVLETQTTLVENGSGSESEPNTPLKPNEPNTKKPKFHFKTLGHSITQRINIYLLLFILLIILSAGISIASYLKSKDSSDKKAAIATEPLSKEVLDQLKATDVKVGDPKQILSVESNAVFGGTVLVRGGLEVAGQIKVGGPLTLPGITVSGSSNFDQVQINNLQIAGNTTVQGQLTVQRGLTVNGPASFGGSLSAASLVIDTLQINRDLQLNRHLDAGGGTPGRSNGGALGAGGTTSVSGTDTAGTVNINTGGGPGAGCFVTVTFTQRFNSVPHVVITPVGSAAGSLNYYINRSTGDFSICTTNAAPAGQSFAFDYVVID